MRLGTKEPKGCWEIQRQEGDQEHTGPWGLRSPYLEFQFKALSLRQSFLTCFSAK